MPKLELKILFLCVSLDPSQAVLMVKRFNVQTQKAMEIDQPVASTSASPAEAETTSGEAEKQKKKKRKADALAALVSSLSLFIPLLILSNVVTLRTKVLSKAMLAMLAH